MPILRGWVKKEEEGFNLDKAPNLCFYKNTLSSSPNGGLIDDIHADWFGSYSLLETHHGYIQWLFPLFEGGGMNFHSEALHKAEAEAMRKDLAIAIRIIKSYKLMLDFYGLVLVDEHTGEVARAKHYKSRYDNLNNSHHNFLRISRIMQSLGHIGFSRYKKPFLEFMQKEVMENKQIPWAKSSLNNYWMPLLDVNSSANAQS
eukprot:Phypoly_transcript_12571.p1 GENE.Phypoly_transcript_12571~~Phypoly_transcript_12571.p1  ORF type:complete len:202 (+),score=19.74 Phypoly_transcript_12571:172-777(+)